MSTARGRTRQQHLNLAADTARIRKKVRAVELRLQFYTEEQIAHELGVSQQTVSRWLDEAMQADRSRLEAAAPDLRALTDARYLWLGQRVAAIVDEGDLQAMATMVRLLAGYAKLHGLEKPAEAAQLPRSVRREYVRRAG